MYAKLIVLTVLLVIMSVALLALRHQHTRRSHDLVQQHRLAHRLQTDLWQAQAHAATYLTPQFVRQQIKRAQLVLDPATPDLRSGSVTDFAHMPEDQP